MSTMVFHPSSSFIDHEQGIVIVEEYDTKYLYPMILKKYHHFHSLIEYENNITNQRVNDDYDLDIFEIIARTNEPTRELVKRELLMLKHFQMNVKKIKCLL